MSIDPKHLDHLGEPNGGLHRPTPGVHVLLVLLGLALRQEQDGVLVLFHPDDGAYVGIETGEYDPPGAAVLQDHVQYRVDVDVDVVGVVQLVRAVLEAHGPLDFDVEADVGVEHLEQLLQGREGLVLLEVFVEETGVFAGLLRPVVHLKIMKCELA